MTAASLGIMVRSLMIRALGFRIVARRTSPSNVQVVPLRPPTVESVSRLKRKLESRGTHVVTTALSPPEQSPFKAAGFTEREDLHLLTRNLRDTPEERTERRSVVLRRAKRADRAAVLAIDRAGFDPFWRFDDTLLRAARTATPKHRYVVATIGGDVAGYAITGLAGATCFVQRLGVDQSFRNRGIGSELVRDGLAWASRCGASRALVNTQVSNTTALSLYQTLGFVLEEEPLTVMEWIP